MSYTATMSDMVQDIMEKVVARVEERRCEPSATYRLQFHAGWTFRDATAIVPYLHRLGISHVYASPLTRARAGSMHGYDVCDYNQLNPELGGEEAFEEFIAALKEHDIGLILDFVPNHMAACGDNPWWWDVLQNGPNSPFAKFFDIDWQPVKEELRNKVLLPILGAQYGAVLESGDLQLEHREGAIWFRYGPHLLPLCPKTILPLLKHRLDKLESILAESSEELAEYKSILTALEHLPAQTATSTEAVMESHARKEVIRRRLRELGAKSPAMATFLNENITIFNGDPKDPRSYDLLDGLLELQNYRLCHWRAASDEVNYRRFFDVNDLAAVCMERPEVFRASHQLIGRLLARGDVDGLRIDHVDGLYAPEQYLWRLQWSYLVQLIQLEADPTTDEPLDICAILIELCRRLRLPAPELEDLRAVVDVSVEPTNTEPQELLLDDLADDHQPDRAERPGYPLFVVVEKILGPDEPLPDGWPVAGTTGYDFTNQLNGMLIEPAGLAALKKQFVRFSGDRRTFREVAHDCKRLIVRFSMASELQMLAHQLNRLSEQNRHTRDFTLNSLRHALREVLANFPVYRTYPGPGGVSERDCRMVDRAVAQARLHSPAEDPETFEFIRDVLLLRHPLGLSGVEIAEREHFAGRFQQVTSPVMAKGVEDTAFYVYFPLVSANEVGGDPGHALVSVEQFHQQNQQRQTRHIHNLLATSTHDTKRSEDVRARINLLAETPRLWNTALNRMSRLARRWRTESSGFPAPSRRDEYLFYQNLLGIWPVGELDEAARESLIERLQNYMDKAIHEAKQQTSWIHPHAQYDQAVRDFVRSCLTPGKGNRFLPEFMAFHQRIVDTGHYSALSQLVLKLMSPGVPDIYQGQEIWDFSLVDPDNRRGVDYTRRNELLQQLQADWSQGRRTEIVRELASSPGDDRLKLLVTWRLLTLRRQLKDWFDRARYVPLSATGRAAEHVIAFAWSGNGDEGSESRNAAGSIIVVAPRWILELSEGLKADGVDSHCPIGERVWGDTKFELPLQTTSALTNLLTGEVLELPDAQLRISDALKEFPVAVWTDLPVNQNSCGPRGAGMGLAGPGAS